MTKRIIKNEELIQILTKKDWNASIVLRDTTTNTDFNILSVTESTNSGGFNWLTLDFENKNKDK